MSYKEFLNEISRMKSLSKHERGVVISEQRYNLNEQSTTPKQQEALNAGWGPVTDETAKSLPVDANGKIIPKKVEQTTTTQTPAKQTTPAKTGGKTLYDVVVATEDKCKPGKMYSWKEVRAAYQTEHPEGKLGSMEQNIKLQKDWNGGWRPKCNSQTTTDKTTTDKTTTDKTTNDQNLKKSDDAYVNDISWKSQKSDESHGLRQCLSNYNGPCNVIWDGYIRNYMPQDLWEKKFGVNVPDLVMGKDNKDKSNIAKTDTPSIDDKVKTQIDDYVNDLAVKGKSQNATIIKNYLDELKKTYGVSQDTIDSLKTKLDTITKK